MFLTLPPTLADKVYKTLYYEPLFFVYMSLTFALGRYLTVLLFRPEKNWAKAFIHAAQFVRQSPGRQGAYGGEGSGAVLLSPSYSRSRRGLLSFATV